MDSARLGAMSFEDINERVRGIVPHHRGCPGAKRLAAGKYLIDHPVKRVLIVGVIEVVCGEHAIRFAGPWFQYIVICVVAIIVRANAW
jgi:hypothetical protein